MKKLLNGNASAWMLVMILTVLATRSVAYVVRTATIARALQDCSLTVATPTLDPVTSKQLDRILANRIFDPSEIKAMRVQLNDGTIVSMVHTNQLVAR